MEKRKRRFGDRKDGYKLRTLDPLTRVSPYIMVNRNECSNLFTDSIDIGRVEEYIRDKRREGLAGFGIMHVIVAAYVRCISQKPAINRFISGQKIFKRDGVEIMLTVKRDMRADSEETIIKLEPELTVTATEIYHMFKSAIDESRANEKNDFDGVAKLFNYIPGLFLKFAIWLVKFFDYFGLLPRALTKASPFHGSLFITSMGSLGIPPIYHHLYDLGNVPVFCSFGAKQKRFELDAEGNVAERHFITLTMVTDERICDGFNFASAFKYIKQILRDPYVLDTPPDKVIEDVE